jgi:glycosyltransferase involved in cell wall biosynthesis
VKPSKRISVLLPVYKGQDTLSLAIRSTLRALGKKDELLVLIQGPGIDRYQLGEFEDKRLSVFYMDQAQGIANALNYLVKKSKGKYVARMDQDDICVESRFRKQLRFLEGRGYDFVFANAVLFGKQIRPFGLIPQLPYGLDSQTSKLFLALQNPFVHPTMLARKSALAALDYFRPCIAEDYDLWLRAATRGFKLGKLKSYGIFYRVHKGQFSQTANFNRRVDTDFLVSESRTELIKSLVNSGQIDPMADSEDQLIAAIKKRKLVFRLQWSSLGKRLLVIANKLLAKAD